MEKNWNHPENFAEYLTGLYEGDGNLYCNEKSRFAVRFSITAHSKDNKFLEKISLQLKCGKIYKVNNKNAIYLAVEKVEDVCNVIEMFRKYLRTPKIHQVNKAISYINKHKQLQIPLVELNNQSFSFSPWWLTGFVEAEGHFGIEAYQPKDKPFMQFRFSFELEQSDIDKTSGVSKKDFMSGLADFFNMSVYLLKKNVGEFVLKILKWFLVLSNCLKIILFKVPNEKTF